jgi:hypothetical protein
VRDLSGVPSGPVGLSAHIARKFAAMESYIVLTLGISAILGYIVCGLGRSVGVP